MVIMISFLNFEVKGNLFRILTLALCRGSKYPAVRKLRKYLEGGVNWTRSLAAVAAPLTVWSRLLFGPAPASPAPGDVFRWQGQFTMVTREKLGQRMLQQIT